jgi:hypothetical protein
MLSFRYPGVKVFLFSSFLILVFPSAEALVMEPPEEDTQTG